MTFLEKFLEEHPEADPQEVIKNFCPDNCGYDKMTNSPCYNDQLQYDCKECWNREVKI